MAEEISTQEPDLTALQADLEASISTRPFADANFTNDTLSAKPEAIDVYKNVVGNPITGTNPQAKNLGVSTMDFAKSLGEASLKETSTQEDPYIKMRPFTYSGDYDAANFDRYYGTKAYKALGFSPYRDNDALYNQKMTFGDQFVRAASQWDNLMSTGFMSGVKSWGTMFTDPLAPDLDSARDMKRSMAIGNVSTGGVGGFVANTFLNSAYSIGIGLEFLAEEALLAAATTFSGGLAGEVTLPAMAARGGFLARQLGKIGELGAKLGNKTDDFLRAAETASKFGKTAEKTAAGINDMGSARQFFGKVASGAFDMINPLESTATALKSTRYANDLAKTVGTAGAFMDDIIRIKTAASEAQLEGGMVKIDATQRLIEQYRELNGKDPDAEALKEIEDLSSIEARRTTLYNFPAIMTTNKLLFSTILYPLNKTLGTASTRVLEDLVAEGGMKALAKDPFKVIPKTAAAQAKAAAKSFAKPALYGTYGMTYLKANLAEGLQENIQEAISQGAINHALAVQKDPGMAAYRGYMGYLMDGLKDQVSAQGAETFASGFLMGMFTQPIMTAPAWAVSKGIERFKNKDEREKAKAERDQALTKQAEALNDMANNDINYWAPDIATAVKNGALSNDLTSSASIGDEKSARDAKFRLEFNHIETAINSGKFEDLMDKLADYKNLTPEEAFEAFQRYNIGINTKEDAVKALDQIDGVIERARAIKDEYQRVAQEFPNPFNLSGVKPGTPQFKAMADSHMAWREAQKNLVFANSEFKNYSQRLQSMTNAFSELASGIAKTDTQSLLSTMSLPGLSREIETLKQELKSLGEVEGQGAIKKQKARSLELLENFQTAILEAHNKIVAKDEEVTDYLEKQVIYQDAKKAYQKYLAHLAKKNDSILFNKTADQAFNILTDSLEMRDEQHRLAESINVLNNPRGFLNLQKRLQDAFGTERSEREQRILENLHMFMTMNDENNIIQAIGKMGIKIPEDFLAEYKEALKNKKLLPEPTYFIDPSTENEITEESDPEKFAQALDVWDTFRLWMHETQDIKEEVTEVPTEVTEEDKKTLDKYNAYDQFLRDNLTALYNTAKTSGKIKDDVSFATFLQTDPDAIMEIKMTESRERLAEEQAKQAATNSIAKWDALISGAVSNQELDKILDQLDKAGDATPLLLDNISRKRATFPKAQPISDIDDIERRRQEELNEYSGQRRTKEEVYEGVGIEDDQENRYTFYTNADGSRTLQYDTKINGKWERVNTERISKDNTLDNETYIEKAIANNRTAKKVSENNNIKSAYDAKINAKYDAELASLETSEEQTIKKEPRKPITNASALKEGDVLIDQAGKEYIFLSYTPATSAVFSPDDNVTFPGEPEEILVKDREDKTTTFYGSQILDLSMKPFAKREIVEKAPVKTVDNVNPAYEGKIVFVTRGSDANEVAKTNKNVVHSDDIVLDTAEILEPDFKRDPKLSAYDNIGTAIAKVGTARLYNEAFKEIKALANSGKTVLTSSVSLMKLSDIVMIQVNKDLWAEDYDQMKEVSESEKVKGLVIPVINPISDVLKKSPEELLGTVEKPVEAPITDPTIDDINQNLTVNNLQIAQEKDYDAIYKNNRYAITKVDENSVTLKTLDGTVVTVKPDEISAVTAKEDVVATSEENKDFKGNDNIIKDAEITLDDSKTKEQRIKDLKNKFC